MFEEGEWTPEAAPAAGLPAARPAASSLPRQPGPADREQHRRRLLATLRRLQEGCVVPRRSPGSPDPDPEDSGGGASDSGTEEEREPRKRRPRTKRRRRRRLEEPEPQQPPGAPAPRKPAKQAPVPAAPPGKGEVATESSGVTSRSNGATERLLTRKQWRNRQKNKRRAKNKFKAGGGIGSDVGDTGQDQPPVGAPTEEPAGHQGEQDPSASMGKELPSSRAASLRLRLQERLDSARFRYINQQLYTCSSQEAARLFQEDPETLAIYHRGFAQQVARWPEKPVQRFVRYLRNRPASLVVADFGCGDCTLARSLRNKVHCFDLVALDPHVTICDMAQVPLEAESVDVAVFCLALMGTNLREILEEANRVLVTGGTLLVAEVASRFRDVRAFVGALARLGFSLVSKDVSGSHFYAFEFRKEAAAPARDSPPSGKPLPGLELRPCLYKRR